MFIHIILQEEIKIHQMLSHSVWCNEESCYSFQEKYSTKKR